MTELGEITVMKCMTSIDEWTVQDDEFDELTQKYYVHYTEGVRKNLNSIRWKDDAGVDHEISNFDIRAILKILQRGEYKL